MSCRNCGKALNKSKVYCNNKCQKEYEYRIYIKKWQHGLVNSLKGKYQISNHIRHYLLKKYNYSCAECGWNKINPFTKICPLEIEHIDGNYQNNSESNLTLLCPNCHSLISTYKGVNRGNGRKERKQYSLYDNPELKL